MRGVASDAMPAGLGATKPDGVALEEDAVGGSVFDAVIVELPLRLASLSDAEVALAFPAVPENGVTE